MRIKIMKKNKNETETGGMPEEMQIHCHPDNIKQDLLDFLAERQKAYDDFMEWYQTEGYLEDEK